VHQGLFLELGSSNCNLSFGVGIFWIADQNQQNSSFFRFCFQSNAFQKINKSLFNCNVSKKDPFKRLKKLLIAFLLMAFKNCLKPDTADLK
jgi:hypothetical protein